MRPAFLLVLLLGLAPAAGYAAEASPPDWQRELRDGADKLRQGVDQALGQLDAWVRAVPQYEMPRLNENGDIIIRRKHPDAPDRGQGTSI